MIRAGIVLIIAVVAVNAVAYAHAVRGTAGDGSISWAIRHPFVMFDLLTDPPPPGNASLVQGGAWLFAHANDVATMLADPPPKEVGP
jgi:hypothetical protein